MRHCWSDKYFVNMMKTYICLIRTYWRVSHSSASPTYTQDPNLFITVPLYARVLDGTRPSAGAVLTTKSYIFFMLWSSTGYHRATTALMLCSVGTQCKLHKDKVSQSNGTEQCWGWDKMAAIFQRTFSNTFSWMKMNEFQLKFHWSLFPRVKLTIFKHWFRLWLGADQAMMVSLLMHICVTWPQWVKTRL